jgi:hypothetical protein
MKAARVSVCNPMIYLGLLRNICMCKPCPIQHTRLRPGLSIQNKKKKIRAEYCIPVRLEHRLSALVFRHFPINGFIRINTVSLREKHNVSRCFQLGCESRL